MALSFMGIALPEASERAWEQGSALAASDDIAEGSAALLRFMAAWVEMYDGDRKCLGMIGDFLSDYFHERAHEAAETLGLSLYEIDEGRTAAVEKLIKGDR